MGAITRGRVCRKGLMEARNSVDLACGLGLDRVFW